MCGLINHIEKNRKLDKLDEAICLCVTAMSKRAVNYFASEAHELIDLLANNRLNELHAMEDDYDEE